MGLVPHARTPREYEIVRLRDGRTVAFAEYGDKGGAPVILLHGTPGARCMFRVAHETALLHGIRLLAPDRPGFGLSQFVAHKSVGEYARDVEALVDALKIDKFSVLGVSGGGPYALACAARLPDRVASAGVVSGVAPLSEFKDHGLANNQRWFMFRLIRQAPPVAGVLFGCLALLVRWSPGTSLERIVRLAPTRDRVILDRPEFRSALQDSFVEAFRDGSRGVRQDLTLLGRPWGFSVESIAARVYLWHGKEDVQVPVEMGCYLAAALPDCRPTFVPNAGHYWGFEHMGKILESFAPKRETALDNP